MDLVTAFLDGARWARQRSLAADADRVQRFKQADRGAAEDRRTADQG